MPSLTEVRVEIDSGVTVGGDVWQQPARPTMMRLAVKPFAKKLIVTIHRFVFMGLLPHYRGVPGNRLDFSILFKLCQCFVPCSFEGNSPKSGEVFSPFMGDGFLVSARVPVRFLFRRGRIAFRDVMW